MERCQSLLAEFSWLLDHRTVVIDGKLLLSQAHVKTSSACDFLLLHIYHTIAPPRDWRKHTGDMNESI